MFMLHDPEKSFLKHLPILLQVKFMTKVKTAAAGLTYKNFTLVDYGRSRISSYTSLLLQLIAN